jgi:hypothetical protein
MSSAGLRLGAIPLLRIRDIIPLDKYKIYKINVYAKSRKSAYFSFYNIQKVTDVKPITTHGIRDFMGSLLVRSGLRKQRTEGKIKRSHVMANHGHRKFFETNAFKAGMDHMYIRRLMGQKSGLEDAYLKLSEEELLEGDSRHVGYLGVVDQLTIDESNKLRREVQALKVEKSSWEALRVEVDNLKALLNKG